MEEAEDGAGNPSGYFFTKADGPSNGTQTVADQTAHT